MSFPLPAPGTLAREALGDIAHAVEVLDPRNAGRLPDFAEAVRTARKTLASNPAARRVTVLCLRGDDERWLVSVGPRGGWKRLWNFGTGR